MALFCRGAAALLFEGARCAPCARVWAPAQGEANALLSASAGQTFATILLHAPAAEQHRREACGARGTAHITARPVLLLTSCFHWPPPAAAAAPQGTTAINSFMKERYLLKREASQRMYSVTTFYIARSMVVTPFQVSSASGLRLEAVCKHGGARAREPTQRAPTGPPHAQGVLCLLFVSIAYFWAGFYVAAGNFFTFVFTLFVYQVRGLVRGVLAAVAHYWSRQRAAATFFAPPLTPPTRGSSVACCAAQPNTDGERGHRFPVRHRDERHQPGGGAADVRAAHHAVLFGLPHHQGQGAVVGGGGGAGRVRREEERRRQQAGDGLA